MTSMPETPGPSETPGVVADDRLLAAHDLARAALYEVTTPAAVGEPAGYTVESDGVVSLRFTNRMPGYPGWFWTVSVAAVEGAEPTVLEVELLPGDEALLAPEWVPWAVRLAEYQAQQTATAEAAAEDEDSSDADDSDDDESGEDLDFDEDDLEDVDDLDAADFDEDGSPILHAGDVDGVDIDELDESADDEDSDDDDADDEADDEESDDDDLDEDADRE
ncbi:DUF3027 domain-containing protein [Microbacterium protaetiae]|uniref:DUF3027 domain-containing protein n=1 Tax=Microbacterium protaetiae TaxID=2509458 RepID=A0A4P6EBP4_9MICO|nr:DUF3027 domain-containing protein [Microbacterium protaetiae]QAY58733.1 DUF3027 domain-containing protein [Microbacterium protaetiae]